MYLQIQLRDIAGFVDTRATMLQLKPGNKSHWISFAIAHHLNGSHDIAAEALKKYEGLQVCGVLVSRSMPRGYHLRPTQYTGLICK